MTPTTGPDAIPGPDRIRLPHEIDKRLEALREACDAALSHAREADTRFHCSWRQQETPTCATAANAWPKPSGAGSVPTDRPRPPHVDSRFTSSVGRITAAGSSPPICASSTRTISELIRS